MGRIDLHAFKVSKEGVIYCISDKERIDNLKLFNHECNVDNIINYIIHNGIYCGLCCEDGNEESVLSEDNMWKLSDSGLLVNNDLIFEALVLCNIEKSYESLEYLERTKEEIDEIVNNSWWVDKFDV